MLDKKTSDLSPPLPGDAGQRSTFAKGDAVFLADDATRGHFFVETGQVRLVRHAVDGSLVTLHVAGPGETFAEASLFAERYHCDAIAEMPTTILQFAKAPALAALRSDPAQALRWIEHLSRQVQRLRAQTALLSLKTAQQRVLGYLRLHCSDELTVTIDRPWKVVASELGLTHEAVYRALARLEQQGSIKRDRRSSTIELGQGRSRNC